MKTQTEKRCPMCETVKQAADFYKNARDGLSPYCKPCSAARKRKGEKTREQIARDVYPSDASKICSKCRSEKPLSEFNFRKRESGRVNYKPYCKACQAELFRSWALRSGRQEKENRAEMMADKRAARYPGNDHKLCSGCGQVKQSQEFGHRFIVGGHCKECRSASESANYAKNKDSRRQYARKYRQENLQMVREMALRGYRVRRERLKAAREDGQVTAQDKAALLAEYGHKCMCCGAVDPLTFDHIVPISTGGKDEIENMQILCGPCNSSKGTRTIDYRPVRKEAV